MMMTLFSPVYNLFAGGAALAGAGASDGKPPLAQTDAAEADAEAQARAPSQPDDFLFSLLPTSSLPAPALDILRANSSAS